MSGIDDRLRELLRTAREHYERKEFDKAEALLRPERTAFDHFADVHNMLGVCAHERRDYMEAERCFERALELNPAYTEAALNLAVTYSDLGKFDEARALHERTNQRVRPLDGGIDPFIKGKIANMHADVAQAYIDSGLTKDAVPELEKAVTLCPQFADLRTRLGNVYRELGDSTRARLQYEAAKKANPRYSAARVALAIVMIAAGEKSTAEEELREVLANEPEHRTAQMYLRMLTGTRPSQLPRPPA
ncbi:MAG: tetratricopeptide repeat protein [Polyangiales bacterium]